MLMLLALLACGRSPSAPPDPLVGLTRDLPSPVVETVRRARIELPGLAVLLTPEAIQVVPLGQFEVAGARSLLNEAWRMPLEEGSVPGPERRGHVILPLLEAGSSRVEAWEELGGFEGAVLVVVDRRVPPASMYDLLYTLGQARLWRFEVLAFAEDTSARGIPATAHGVPQLAERAKRLEPGSSVRAIQTWEPVKNEPPYADLRVDDAGATYVLELADPEVEPVTETNVRALLELPESPSIFPSFLAAAQHAACPVLPSLEMLLLARGEEASEVAEKAVRLRRDARVPGLRVSDEALLRLTDRALRAEPSGLQAIRLPTVDPPGRRVLEVAPELQVEPLAAASDPVALDAWLDDPRFSARWPGGVRTVDISVRYDRPPRVVQTPLGGESIELHPNRPDEPVELRLVPACYTLLLPAEDEAPSHP